MQNLILLSIFQTYAELLGGRVIFGIEEPEIYLYPQAQRALYKSFKNLSKESQIFYTTHNINFVDSARPDDLVILRKSENGTYPLKKASFFNSINAEKQKYKIYTHFNQQRNELFFAKKILLVEGDSDRILIHTFCEEKWNIDVDSEGISIIECGGKAGVIYFLGVCKLIGHDNYFAIWDKDNENKIDDANNILKDALNNNQGLEFNPDMETELGICKGDKVRNAHAYVMNLDNNSIPIRLTIIQNFLNNTPTIEENDDIPF